MSIMRLALRFTATGREARSRASFPASATVLALLSFVVAPGAIGMPGRTGAGKDGAILATSRIAITLPAAGQKRAEEVVVDGGLNNPRDVAVDSNGDVFLVDAGSPSVILSSGPPNPGRVVRISPGGIATSLLTDIGNLSGSDPEFGNAHLHGVSGVAVHEGFLYVVLGEEAWVSTPLIAPNRLVRAEAGGEWETVFDLNLLESEQDPDGAGVESNATGVALAPDGRMWVGDAAGNWIAHLTADGALETVVSFPQVDGEDPVPTGIAIGPDGAAYVALFRCRSPTAGKGGIMRVMRDGTYDLVATELSAPIDVAFDGQGAMLILEFAVDYAPESGRVVRVSKDGSREVMLYGLSFPTGLAVDAAGGIYITEMVSPSGQGVGSGRLLYVAPPTREP